MPPVDLAYEQHGAGPDLVILHGLFGSARNWRMHARELASDYRVTVVDLRNHGQSPHAPAMSYEDMAADLAAFLRRLRLENAVVLGHSMGGKAAMTLALSEPHRVMPVIIADIAPVPYPPRFQHVISGLQNLVLAEALDRGAIDQALAQWIPEPGLRTFLLTNLVRDGAVFRWRVNLPTIVASMPLIEGFSLAAAGPTEARAIFLAGEHSTYIDAAGKLAIARLFPNSSIEVIDGAGHWLHADQPMLFIDAVRRSMRLLT